MFSALQVILVCLWTWLFSVTGMSVQIFTYAVAVLHGIVVGLIMGDLETGLQVGGTLCLMGLGVGGYGGSSVPDYNLGTIVGTVFAVGSGQGLEAGLAVGIPVAALGTEFDIIAKMCGSFFIHGQMAVAKKKEFNKMGLYVHGWNVFRAFLYTLPVLLVMTVGSGLITGLLEAMPEWLTKGLNTAAGMLPAVGFAILLKYLPVKEYGVFLIFGYAAAAYLGLSMLAISMFALVLAFIIYRQLEISENDAAVAASTGTNGGDYDE